jgi:hypothetical protein
LFNQYPKSKPKQGETAMKTKIEQKMSEYWEDIEDALQYAHLIAWDGCHKIYLAMDEGQEQWFKKNYKEEEDTTSCNFVGSTQEMLKMIQRWWEFSCPLRFVQSVETNHEDPNAGFKSLIPQGAEDPYGNEEDEEEYF